MTPLYRHKRLRNLLPWGHLILILLSIYGLSMLSKSYIKKTDPEHVTEVFLCCPNYPPFSKYHNTPSYFAKKRIYQNFQLTPDTLTNMYILEHVKRELNLIKKNSDTIFGIHVILDDSTKYMDYIKTMDICYEKFPKVFASFENHIWAFYIKIDTTDFPKDILEKKRKRGEFDY